MTTVINFITQALGDNIAFSPYADVYQQKFGGHVYVKTKWYKILTSSNSNVYFIDIDQNIKADKVFDIHFYFINGPLQKIICDQLGITYSELLPTIKCSDKYKFDKKKRYVCISTQSTAQLKYWNNGVGWDKTVRYLKELGYDVYDIDKDYSFGVKEKWNFIPKGAKNETGNYPIEYRVSQIRNSEFFIGISSGLSWLAWSLGKKVITISGCTIPNNEFFTNNYRVINTNVCYGCLNDETINNKDRILSDGWFYCPRNKDFECSKQITFEMVKEKIDACILDLNKKYYK